MAQSDDTPEIDTSQDHIKPEPKRETVALWAQVGAFGLRKLGTIDLEDGKPVPGSEKYDTP